MSMYNPTVYGDERQCVRRTVRLRTTYCSRLRGLHGLRVARVSTGVALNVCDPRITHHL